MSIAETPIATIQGSRRATVDGVHLVARRYEKGVRLDTHMHREAQQVYAARGTMQVTTPKGRWLVPPDRAVWVPARLGHSIDVLADIDMRTLYFEVPWLAQEKAQREPRCRIRGAGVAAVARGDPRAVRRPQ
jgi:quercetin dioxygenase-like cupin family protein